MKNLSVEEFFAHLSIVVITLFVLNYPGFDLTLGVFNGGNGTLLWPSIVGTAINMALFYGISFYLIPEVLRKRGLMVFAIQSLIFFSLLTFVEVVVDLSFLDDEKRSTEMLSEVIIVAAMFNALFAILAFAYRFSRDWFVHEKQRSAMRE